MILHCTKLNVSFFHNARLVYQKGAENIEASDQRDTLDRAQFDLKDFEWKSIQGLSFEAQKAVIVRILLLGRNIITPENLRYYDWDSFLKGDSKSNTLSKFGNEYFNSKLDMALKASNKNELQGRGIEELYRAVLREADRIAARPIEDTELKNSHGPAITRQGDEQVRDVRATILEIKRELAMLKKREVEEGAKSKLNQFKGKI